MFQLSILTKNIFEKKIIRSLLEGDFVQNLSKNYKKNNLPGAVRILLSILDAPIMTDHCTDITLERYVTPHLEQKDLSARQNSKIAIEERHSNQLLRIIQVVRL